MLNRKLGYMAGACVVAAYLFVCTGHAYSEEPGSVIVAEKEKRKVTVSIAFTAYYANWAPVWKIYRKKFPVYTERDFSLPKGTFMYGPSVSLTVDRWQISGSFLYGEFKGSLLSYDFLPPLFSAGPSYILPYSSSLKAKKYDCDLLVGYQINALFKFFFGPKYQGYQYKKNNSSNLIFTTSTEDIKYHSGGLGVGVGCTVPITGDLFLLMKFSGVVLVGSQKGSSDHGDRTSVAYGGNEIVTLAYHIRAIKTVISVGGRLQYLYLHITPHRYYPTRHDIFYGINMSAGVSF